MLGLTVASVGTLLALAWALSLYRMKVDPELLASVLEKTLRSGDRDRAVKLCKSIPETASGQTLLAVFRRADELRAGAAREAARTALDEAFQDEHTRVVTRLRSGFPRALLAGGLLASAVVREVLLGAAPGGWLIGLTAVGVAVLLWSGWTAQRIAHADIAVFERVAPALVEALRRPALGGGDGPFRSAPEATTGLQFAVYRNGRLLRSETVDLPVIKLGRLAKSHLVLDGEGVSRMHAVIEWSGGAATLIDLGAGTLLNGALTNKASLRQGDVIGIGEFDVVVGLGAAPPPLPGAAPRLAADSIPPWDVARWNGDAGILYEFRDRSPDAFFDALARIADEPSAARVALAKLRRREGSPICLVAVAGDPSEVALFEASLARLEPPLAERLGTSAQPESVWRAVPDTTLEPRLAFAEKARYFELRAELAARGFETVAQKSSGRR